MICSNCCQAVATGVFKWENVYYVACDACGLFFTQWAHDNKGDDVA